MKRLLVVFFVVSIIVAACKSAPPPPAENPGVGPVLKVQIPELFSPDPDVVGDKMTISITVEHPVPIKDWNIQIQPARRQAAQQQTGAAQPAPARERTSEQAGQAGERQAGQARQQRGPFFEQSGTGTPPKTWQWDGKSSRSSGEMVQSAMDYQFTLSANDVFDNNSTYEGIISVDVLVRREGNNLRIIVPSIVFPANSSDFNLLSDDDRRSNTRILRLIANALNKYQDYKITVEGHANPTTPPNTQQRTTEEAGNRNVLGLKPLSQARASAVVDYLVSNNNIARTRLSSVGIGGERTVAEYNDDEENWKNRRVEFILQK